MFNAQWHFGIGYRFPDADLPAAPDTEFTHSVNADNLAPVADSKFDQPLRYRFVVLGECAAYDGNVGQLFRRPDSRKVFP